ncbi:MAG: amidohydrolase [Lautropia sp.]
MSLPPNTCDSHCHIIGPASDFPLRGQVDPSKPSPDYPKAMLAALHAQLGIDRAVVVQSARHGNDNAAIEDAVRSSAGRWLGIAVVAPAVADEELARLAAAGIRGVRFNFMRHIHASAPIDAVIALTHRLARHQLHLQVHFESDLIHSLAPYLKASAVPVVIDHMGRVDAKQGPEHPNFAALMQLLADDRFLVKVSGIDRIDADPPYSAGCELTRRLAERYPDRCLWGSDWPHLNHTHVPDDRMLVRLIDTIAPDAGLRERLLVRNPERLYRFPPTTTHQEAR